MTVKVHNIAREFTPAEAEAATGVSVALQRDWRRRGLLPKNESSGWTKFSLDDVIRMAVMKHFSDAGIIIKSTDDLAQMAVLPTTAFIEQLPGAIAYEGDKISDKLLDAIKAAGITRNAHGRFLARFVSDDLPAWKQVARFNSLADIEAILEERWLPCFVVLDLRALAETIFASIGESPLYRVEIEVENDAE